MTRLQELGYSSLEALKAGRRAGRVMDWVGMDQLYKEVTAVKGGNIMDGEIIADSNIQTFGLAGISPQYNLDFGACVELVPGRPMKDGVPVRFRHNQPVVLRLDFQRLDGDFSIFLTDKLRRKYKPDLQTFKSPAITYSRDAGVNRYYKVHLHKTVLQEADPKAECRAYGPGSTQPTLQACRQQEQQEFFMRKLACVPPQYTANSSLMCGARLSPDLWDSELTDYMEDLATDSEPTDCPAPCSTFDISATLTAEIPSGGPRLLKLIFSKDFPITQVEFRCVTLPPSKAYFAARTCSD
jgi:hypothetical protein